ncbi:TetR/AcrR family transcriptional regulator [Actinoplanes sp. M2I2]|uniref:TetR/AcrR family transcriptional regulator n=1 Tax=Actinoplanes sp. M2I2 TaxID=1734444 RepID=UPI0020224CC9|nr:TetR/AcrR family transcriptional regulator [Actinoplanes sp. M2I2]
MKSERRTQEQRSTATRAALIEAARPLFAASGFAAVSTEAIVRAAGVTRGAMYHQFADKTELFAAVFEAVEADLTKRIGSAVSESGLSDPIALMKLGAATWLDAGAEPEVQRIVLIEAPSVLGWERWRELSFRYGMGLVHSLVELAISSGRLLAQPPEPLSHVLIGALDEASLYVARSDDPARARREVGAVIDRLIASLAA